MRQEITGLHGVRLDIARTFLVAALLAPLPVCAQPANQPPAQPHAQTPTPPPGPPRDRPPLVGPGPTGAGWMAPRLIGPTDPVRSPHPAVGVGAGRQMQAMENVAASSIEVGPLMRVLDTNRDGQLSPAEIKRATRQLKKLDLDDDGLISSQELGGPGPRPAVANALRPPLLGPPRAGMPPQPAVGPGPAARRPLPPAVAPIMPTPLLPSGVPSGEARRNAPATRLPNRSASSPEPRGSQPDQAGRGADEGRADRNSRPMSPDSSSSSNNPDQPATPRRSNTSAKPQDVGSPRDGDRPRDGVVSPKLESRTRTDRPIPDPSTREAVRGSDADVARTEQPNGSELAQSKPSQPGPKKRDAARSTEDGLPLDRMVAGMREALDKNQDGRLTADELPGRVADKFLERFDKNGDRALDTDELGQMLRGAASVTNAANSGR